METSRVLILQERPEAAADIKSFLTSGGITEVAVAPWTQALTLLREKRFSAVVCDLDEMPVGGHKILAAIQREIPSTASIVITQGSKHPTLVGWEAAGAFECLRQRLDRSAMLAVVHRALMRNKLGAGNSFDPATSRQRADKLLTFTGLIGDSKAMQEVYRTIGKVAQSDANVCLYGESGTGKELIARAIHDSGRRQGLPFVILDCAAIPEGLMESEMFGHVRGAFTSAVGDRVGFFQLADTGTLFLDEVAELPLPLQAKLLRVIQNREFRRVGSSHPVRVDVRIIAATNRDLVDLVKRGQFREDIFYRLDVISIAIPPLRERKEDIPLLVDHFVKAFSGQGDKQIRGVSARTLRMLLKYDWPGNVRELQNCIERAVVMAEGDVIDIGDMYQLLHPVAQDAARADGAATLREMEKTAILEMLRQTRGNKTATAALLGISLRGLHYKLRKLEKAGIRTELS